MAICVMADMSGVTKRTVTSDEIKAEVARLNAVTGRVWEVEQVSRIVSRKRWFRKERRAARYSVYLDCHGEWQLINFPPSSEGAWSINTEVDYRTLMTMLHWYLAGLSDLSAEADRKDSDEGERG